MSKNRVDIQNSTDVLSSTNEQKMSANQPLDAETKVSVFDNCQCSAVFVSMKIIQPMKCDAA